jgi:sigma-B regulation protein RsbQ
MWRFVVPAFAREYRTVAFDFVGAGGSDLSAYDPRRHASLDGYAADLLEVLQTLDAREVIFVGHSVSAMIGVLAANREPHRFAALVLVGQSPRYTADGDYDGGFTEADIEDLLTSLDRNYLGWSAAMAPGDHGQRRPARARRS